MTHFGLPGTTSNDALAVEHEIQRLMLERLGIEWTPGEPFYSLVEAEIVRLRAELRVTQETAKALIEGDQKLTDG